MAFLVPIFAVISVITTVSSVVYQLVQSKKKTSSTQRSQATPHAEARRGFEAVVEGTPVSLPKAYGRVKLGGIRVFHATKSSFRYATPNSDTLFETGPSANSSGSFSMVEFDKTGKLQTVTRNYSAIDDGMLNRNHLTGTQNEFLFFQQAICQGPIHAIHDIIIDGSRFIDDPSLGTQNTTTWSIDSIPKAAMRVDCHHLGGVADSIMTANFSKRSTATFDDMAYLSVVIRLDGTNPQFSNVPNIQVLAEAALVRNISGGVLSSQYAYDNNSALCLADYLLDDISGKGLSIDELDLNSFEVAARICNVVVKQNVQVGGLLYGPTDGGRGAESANRNGMTRDVKLYECNFVVDVNRPIRENIESILSTMGDARLVWVNGKYSLNLQYPRNNTDLVLAATLKDSDLVLAQKIEMSWPTSAERLNHCVIKYHNENEMFKEDSVGWPPKLSYSQLRGLGGHQYPQANVSMPQRDVQLEGQTVKDEYNNEGGKFLNEFGVWHGTTHYANFDFRFIVPKARSGKMKLRYTGSEKITITVFDQTDNNRQVYIGYLADHTYLQKVDVVLGSKVFDHIIHINIKGESSDVNKAVAADLTFGNYGVWTTRDVTYTSYEVYNSYADVYLKMLAEDGGQELETEIFAEGVTDFYHAMAKAEELVRTSRSAFTVKLQYIVGNKFLTPGAFIKIESESLNLGDVGNELYARVEDARIVEGVICELTVSRFDASFLAWNVDDNEYIKPKELYNSFLMAPAWINYTPSQNGIKDTSGILEWAWVSDAAVVGYVLYWFPAGGKFDVNGFPLFQELGRTSSLQFQLPKLDAASAFFGVKSITKMGRLSNMTYTSNTKATLLVSNSYDFSNLVFTTGIPAANNIYWVAFDLLVNTEITLRVPGGHFAYTGKTLYLYYDYVKNKIKSSNSLVAAKTGRVLAVYNGDINKPRVWLADLLPPGDAHISGRDDLIYYLADMVLEWNNNPGNVFKTGILNHYRVQVVRISDNAIIYKTNVYPDANKNGKFTFTHALNVQYFGEFVRKYEVRIQCVDIQGYFSNYSKYIVDNPRPVQVTNIHIYTGYKSIIISYTRPIDVGWGGVVVFIKSGNPDFIPSDSTLVYVGTDSTFTIPNLKEDVEYYIRIGSYDLAGGPEDYTLSDSIYKKTISSIITLSPNDIKDKLQEALDHATSPVVFSGDAFAIKLAGIDKTPFIVGAIDGSPAILLDADVGITGKVSADLITSGTLAVSESIQLGGGNAMINGDGSFITYKDNPPTVYSDFAILNGGTLSFQRYRGGKYREYKSVKRVEYGEAVAGVLTRLPGYWDSQPNIIVSPHALLSYSAPDTAASQKWKVYVDDVHEDPAGSGIWYFTPVVELSYSASADTVSVVLSSGETSSDNWSSAGVSIPSNATTFVAIMRVRSIKASGSGTYAYQKRKVTYSISGSNDGVNWTQIGATRVRKISAAEHGDYLSVRVSRNITAGAWAQIRMDAVAANDTGTYSLGDDTYTYSYANVLNNGDAAHAYAGAPATEPIAYGPVALNMDNFTPPVGTEIYQIEYAVDWVHFWYLSGTQATVVGNTNSNIVYDSQTPTGSDFNVGTNLAAAGSKSGTGRATINTNSYDPNYWKAYVQAWGFIPFGLGTYDVTWSTKFALSNGRATIKLRTKKLPSTTQINEFGFESFHWKAPAATAISTGSMNWMAVGD